MSRPILITLPVERDVFLSFEFDRQLDIIVDLFEASLREGRSPVISEFVDLVEPRFQKRILRELILVEREFARFREGPQEKSAFDGSDTAGASDTAEMSGSETAAPSGGWQSRSEGDLPTHFAQFAIHKLLGRGSHGIVYEAEDLEIRRRVALKIAQSVHQTESRREFSMEAANASRVDHPSVVKILHVGEHRGTEYMVSELIEGSNLRDFVDSQKLNDRQRVQIVADIANGIAAAHKCNVIHRDLKPSNIMIESPAILDPTLGSAVDELDEPEKPNGPLEAAVPFSLDGYRVRILDFGIAKMLDRLTRRTVQGDVVGTPHYMSPEQASGNSATVDSRSDIFSLGVILYELLCGQLPFEGSEIVVLSGIRDLKVPPIRTIRSDLPAALEQVIQKCLERNPDQRYQSALELEADLRKWLAGEKTMALRSREVKRFAMGSAAVGSVCLLIGIAALALRAGWFTSESWRGKEDRATNNAENVVPPKVHLESWLDQGEVPALLVWTKSTDARSRTGDIKSLVEKYATGEPSWRWNFARLFQETDLAEEPQDLTQLANSFIANVDEKYWLEATLAVPDRFINELEQLVFVEKRQRQRETLFRIVADRWVQRSDLEGLMRLFAEANMDELHWLVPTLLKFANGPSPDFKTALMERFDSTGLELDASGKVRHGAPQPESTARWRGKLGLIAFGLQDWERVDRILAASIDPRARNYFIYWFEGCKFSINPLLDRFADYQDDWQSTAVLACMSRIPNHRISSKQRDQYIGILKDAYLHHPSSAVHRSARKLLTLWGRSDIVAEADASDQAREIRSDRNWYRTPSGMTMNIVRGPTTFWYGPPTAERRTFRGGLTELPHSFAVADHLVSEVEYSQFDPSKYPTPTDRPAKELSWVEANKYCDWLNRKEGIEDRTSIEMIDETTMRFSESILGYRLLNIWEWECYHRASTETSYSIGEVESDFFADLILPNPSDSKPRTQQYFGPGPTDLVGSDMGEWVSTDFDASRSTKVVPTVKEIKQDNMAVWMGGFYGLAKSAVTQHTISIRARTRNENAGIRLCRTMQ